MTRYVRTSTPSASARAFAATDGLTLKPMTTALDAAASMMSDSLMPPTPEWITCTLTSGWLTLLSASSSASTDPPTSPLMTRASSLHRLFLQAAIEVVQTGGRSALGHLLHAQAGGAPLGPVPRLALVLDHLREVARSRERC